MLVVVTNTRQLEGVIEAFSPRFIVSFFLLCRLPWFCATVSRSEMKIAAKDSRLAGVW